MMKLTAGGKPFGEKNTKAEALEAIRQSAACYNIVITRDAGVG